MTMNPLQRALSAALLALSALPLAGHASTVFSANFDDGTLGGGSTAYSAVPSGTFSAPGQYAVVGNPSTYFSNGYDSFGDHTSGAGKMLFFDGAGGPASIWSDSVALVGGTTYTFEFYGASGSDENVPALQLYIDGSAVNVQLTPAAGQWGQYLVALTPSASGTYTFSIQDNNFIGEGNDGAIDDISLTAPNTSSVPEPQPVALMLAGLGALAALARRRDGRSGR